MPASSSFLQRVFNILPYLLNKVDTPFYLYDQKGIAQTCAPFLDQFVVPYSYKNYFAIKALPNIHILKELYKLGMGFDCSSKPEIELALEVGASGNDIFFTSNNTTKEEISFALAAGVQVNIDDLSILKKMPELPTFLCFRMSPEEVHTDDKFMNSGSFSKFGMRRSQLLEAFKYAKSKGVRQFGLHGMFNSNEKRLQKILSNIIMLFEELVFLETSLNLQIDLLNLGGGLGIPYQLGEDSLDIYAYFSQLKEIHNKYQHKVGHKISVVNECGRYITGPHGIIITSITNLLEKKERIVGVDASLCTLFRPALYGFQHAITPISNLNISECNEKALDYYITGSLCESIDILGILSTSQLLKEDMPLIIHDAGAHCHSMSFSYNGRLRPAEIILNEDNSLVKIRDQERVDRYYNSFVYQQL